MRVHHPWMKDGQSLRDILVPVVVNAEGLGNGLEELAAVLDRVLDQKTSQLVGTRLALLGAPGSGKSVGLRVAASNIWRYKAQDGLGPIVPVLITFAEYRASRFDLVEAIVASLCSRNFYPKSGYDEGASARTFVVSRLSVGGIAILIDALDELAQNDRTEAMQRLKTEIAPFPRAHVFFTCRKAAWNGAFALLNTRTIHMADFTPRDIARFIHNWEFLPPKSSLELYNCIQAQSHLAELARNPLMLTIIAYLYGQPRYRLPDNRALFYEVCTHALVAEWDQAQNPQRANQFDRPHKEQVLSHIAFEHMCSPDPDQDIEQETAETTVAKAMDSLGLRRGANIKLLEEIIINSGLLVRLPPSGLRYPHRTFLEYFAAKFLISQGDTEKLLELYESDPVRWREVMLLCCGLSASNTISSAVIAHCLAKQNGEMAVLALANTRVVSPERAEEVLNLASNILRTKPTTDLVAALGHIAANELSAYSDPVTRMLRRTLKKSQGLRHSPKGFLQELLVAVLRRPTEDITTFVVAHADDLDLKRILPAMEDRAIEISLRVLRAPQMSSRKKREWITGLLRADAIPTIFELGLMTELDSSLRTEAICALVRTSRSAAFRSCLNSFHGEVDMDPETEKLFRKWTWPFPDPEQRNAQRLAFFFASTVARAVAKGATRVSSYEIREVDIRISYLIRGLVAEYGTYLQRKWPDVISETYDEAPACVLSSIWRASVSRKWLFWISALAGDEDRAIRTLTASALPWLLFSGYCLYALLVPYTGHGPAAMPQWMASSWIASILIVSGWLYWPQRNEKVEGVSAISMIGMLMLLHPIGLVVLGREKVGAVRHALLTIIAVACVFALYSIGILIQIGAPIIIVTISGLMTVLLLIGPAMLSSLPMPPLLPSVATSALAKILKQNRSDPEKLGDQPSAPSVRQSQ